MHFENKRGSLVWFFFELHLLKKRQVTNLDETISGLVLAQQMNQLIHQSKIWHLFSKNIWTFYEPKNLIKIFIFFKSPDFINWFFPQKPFKVGKLFKCGNYMSKYGKVRTFWEAHKNLRNLPHALYIYLVNPEEDFFKFHVLLRKSEL